MCYCNNEANENIIFDISEVASYFLSKIHDSIVAINNNTSDISVISRRISFDSYCYVNNKKIIQTDVKSNGKFNYLSKEVDELTLSNVSTAIPTGFLDGTFYSEYINSGEDTSLDKETRLLINEVYTNLLENTKSGEEEKLQDFRDFINIE